MEFNLKLAGALLIVLALLHAAFPKYLRWKQELPALSLVNRQIMYVHSFFIGLAVFLMGFLCLSSAHELLSTPLGKKIALGLGVFWSARLCIQFFGYSSRLWKGKPIETTLHIFLSIFWTYLSAIFFLTYLA
jgi:hypothetical protein